MAERLKAVVLKTTDPQGSGGSNPSPSARSGGPPTGPLFAGASCCGVGWRGGPVSGPSGAPRRLPISSCLLVKGGRAPLSHFPPVRQAANKVRCHQFLLAQDYAAREEARGRLGTPTSGRHSGAQRRGRSIAEIRRARATAGAPVSDRHRCAWRSETPVARSTHRALSFHTFPRSGRQRTKFAAISFCSLRTTPPEKKRGYGSADLRSAQRRAAPRAVHRRYSSRARSNPMRARSATPAADLSGCSLLALCGALHQCRCEEVGRDCDHTQSEQSYECCHPFPNGVTG